MFLKHCLLLYIVVPNSYWIFQSNQYDDSLQCLQDPQCSTVISTESTDDDRKRGSESQVLLQCAGPSSALFDGVIGREIPGIPENTDSLQHYTWHQEFTSNPYVAMSFDPPLVELPNVTMYLYRSGILDIRVPFITMCFSRSLNFNPCNNIELPERPRLSNGVVIWPVTLLTNATSVTYLRIDMQYDNDDINDFIFFSELRIAERLQGIVV